MAMKEKKKRSEKKKGGRKKKELGSHDFELLQFHVEHGCHLSVLVVDLLS